MQLIYIIYNYLTLITKNADFMSIGSLVFVTNFCPSGSQHFSNYHV
jgi:hypothetical protein